MTGGTGPIEAAIADTSLFIALEQERPLADAPPPSIAVSVVTIAELRLGVLAAATDDARARRLDTLTFAESLEPFPVNERAAAAWARLRLDLRRVGRRMPVNDSWIAATAIANHMAVVTQDADYDGTPGLVVVRV